jgi:hypothetical protein
VEGWVVGRVVLPALPDHPCPGAGENPLRHLHGYPCLVNGKADAHIICVEPALRHPNVHLPHQRPCHLAGDPPDGRTATRVVVDRDGTQEEYSADVVVTSCGAINSAACCWRRPGTPTPTGSATAPTRSAGTL